LAEGIVALAKISFASQTSASEGTRVDILQLLAEIPKSRWDTEGWIDLKAAARSALADALALGDCAGAPQACSLIEPLKQRLDWGLATGRTVYVQFAGMVRGDVEKISAQLRRLGWSLPGEERVASAAGLNEVRYGRSEDDRRAAELLAA